MSTSGPDDTPPPSELQGLDPKDLLQAGLETVPPVTLPPQSVDPDATVPVARPQSTQPVPQVELPLPEELTQLLPAGAYHVESFLGQGGMGAVYKGMQVRLKRPVAIKIMRRDMGKDYDFEARFEREAQAMAKLNHPNIVSVIDFGEAGADYLYIVMELIDGADLMDVIRGGQMTQEMALSLLPQVCDALQFAHDHGIVHRDIKPSNIMITRDGRVKMCDFGLAKRYDVESSFRTQTGTGMGTPDYAAPEQFDPKANIDHRADIYALGVMIYQMITGQLPRGVWKLPSQRAEVAPQWDAIVSRAMQSDPIDRYQQASEVKTDVERVSKLVPPGATSAPSPTHPSKGGVGGANQEISSTSRSRAPLLIGLVVGVIVIASGAFFVFRKPAADQVPTSAAAGSSTQVSPNLLSSITRFPQEGWQPLVPQALWEKSVPKRKFADGLLHVTGDYVYAKLPGANPADGAIRSTVKLLAQTQNPSVHARWRGTSGYQLLLQGDIGKMSAQLFFVRDKNSGSLPLAVRKLSKQPIAGESVTLELRIQGNHLTGLVNGEVCVEATNNERSEAGEWGIYASNAWFESVDVQPLPAAAVSPSPSLPVSKTSTQFPPGQWVKLFTKAEDLTPELRRPEYGVTWENGHIIGKGRGFFQPPAFPLTKNHGIRFKVIEPKGVFGQIRVREASQAGNIFYSLKPSKDGKTLSISREERLDQAGPTARSLSRSEKVLPLQLLWRIHESNDIEMCVVESALYARVNGTLLAVKNLESLAPGNPVVTSLNGSFSNIEAINLDGLSEAEALKILGVDEKGNDLRGKAGEASASVTSNGWIDLLAQMDPILDAWKASGPVGANQWKRNGTALAYIADGKVGKITAPGLLFSGSCEMQVSFIREADDVNVHLDLIGSSSSGNKTGSFALEFSDREMRGFGKTLLRSDKPFGAQRTPIRIALAFLESDGLRTMRVSVNGFDPVTIPIGTTEPLSGTPALSIMAGRAGAVFHEWRFKLGTAKWTANRELVFKGPSLPSAPAASREAEAATKDAPFINTLGMKFVPVPETKVLFSIWHTRVQDYAEFAKAQEAAGRKVDGSWKTQAMNGMPVGREPDHPVVGVSWDDAQAFCQWLTNQETAAGKLPKGAKYRLCTDSEWSTAVGLPTETGATPEEKHGKNDLDFPWGKAWPPPPNAGNYADETFHAQFQPKKNEKAGKMENEQWMEGYTDGYPTTSPVGAFPANVYGLYDIGGNVWQWCEDWWNTEHKDRVLRGAPWKGSGRYFLRSSARLHIPAALRVSDYGFRCVLESDNSKP